MRRTLLVPIRALAPSADPTSCSVDAVATARQHDGVARVLARQHRADRQAVGQHGRHVLAAVHGEVDLAGQQASSISFTKSRLPPISDSVASASRSPDVLMTTISQSTPACVFSSAAVAFA